MTVDRTGGTTAMEERGDRGIEPLERCRMLSIPLWRDDRGSLIVAESGNQLPFSVQRVFCIFDVPDGAVRAAHANRVLHEVLIAIAGSVTVELSCPDRQRSFALDDPATGLYVHPLTWLEIRDFSPGTMLLVLASTHYDPDEHITSMSEYHREYAQCTNGPNWS